MCVLSFCEKMIEKSSRASCLSEPKTYDLFRRVNTKKEASTMINRRLEIGKRVK